MLLIVALVTGINIGGLGIGFVTNPQHNITVADKRKPLVLFFNHAGNLSKNEIRRLSVKFAHINNNYIYWPSKNKFETWNELTEGYGPQLQYVSRDILFNIGIYPNIHAIFKGFDLTIWGNLLGGVIDGISSHNRNFTFTRIGGLIGLALDIYKNFKGDGPTDPIAVEILPGWQIQSSLGFKVSTTKFLSFTAGYGQNYRLKGGTLNRFFVGIGIAG